MQLVATQLAGHLGKGLKSLYTLHGDEPLLIQEAADSIRAHARKAGYTERSSFTVAGAHFDWSEVMAAGGSLSLFADKQIVELRIPSGKPGKDGSVALQQLAEQAVGNDSTLTLVMLPRLDKLAKTSGWFTALEAHGMTVGVEPVLRNALPQWIAQRLAANGQRVADGEEGQRTLQFFADRVEGNLLAAHQEVQKLALLYGAPTLPASRGSLPPEGASSPWGGPSEKAPTLPASRGSLPPEGASSPRGGLSEKAPTLPASRGSLPPEGASSPWGGPSEKAPTLPASRGSLPPEGASSPRGGLSEKGLLAPSAPTVLSFEQVENAVLNVARYDVFKLSEAVLAGQHLRVQRMLDGLQAEGEAEVLVHWALAEDIRALKRVKDAMAQGRPLPLAMREQRIWGVKERLFERVLPRLTDAAVLRLLHAAHQVDGIVKGLKQPDWPANPWQALHRLAMMLCRECSAGTAKAA